MNDTLVPIPELDFCPRYKANLETGKIWDDERKSYLKIKPNLYGYRYSTFNVNGDMRRCSVHTLIYSAGMGVKSDYWKAMRLQINHKNGKDDDSFKSLELCSHKQQYEDEYDPHVRSKLGKGTRLSKEDVRDIRACYEVFEGKVSYFAHCLSQVFGCHYITIKNVIDGKSFKNVG